MLFGGGVSNYYVVSVGEGVRQGETGMFLPWRHTQCHGEVRPGGAAKAGTRHTNQAWGGGGGGAAICAAVAYGTSGWKGLNCC